MDAPITVSSVQASLSESTPTSTTPSAASITSNPTSQAGAVQSNTSSPASSSTRVRTVNDLREKAPEVWQKTLEGLATNICGQMKRHQERLKAMMRKATNGEA